MIIEGQLRGFELNYGGKHFFQQTPVGSMYVIGVFYNFQV